MADQSTSLEAGAAVVRLPLAYLLVFVLGYGVRGAWYAMAVSMVAQGILALYRFRSGRWKTMRV